MAFRKYRKIGHIFAEQQTKNFTITNKNPHTEEMHGIAGDWLAHGGDPDNDNWVISKAYFAENYEAVR